MELLLINADFKLNQSFMCFFDQCESKHQRHATFQIISFVREKRSRKFIKPWTTNKFLKKY